MSCSDRMENAMLSLDIKCMTCRNEITCANCNAYNRCDRAQNTIAEILANGEGLSVDEAEYAFQEEHLCASCMEFDCDMWDDCLEWELCRE